MFSLLLAHFLLLGCWTWAAFPRVYTNSLLLCVSHYGSLWAGKSTERERLYKAWDWPRSCVSPTPSLSTVRQGLCEVERALNPYQKTGDLNTDSVTYPLMWAGEMCLTLISHSLLLCKMRFVVRICEIMGKLLAQCPLCCGCSSNMSWIWIWQWHHWQSIWSISIALNQGPCSFIKFLHCSCSPWLMLEFTGICNKSPIKQ